MPEKEAFPKNSFTGGAIPKNDCCRGKKGEGEAVKERAGTKSTCLPRLLESLFF